MCAKASMEDFEALLKESFEIDTPEEGTVVKGKVIAIEAGQAEILEQAAARHQVGERLLCEAARVALLQPAEDAVLVGGDAQVRAEEAREVAGRGEAEFMRDIAHRFLAVGEPLHRILEAQHIGIDQRRHACVALEQREEVGARQTGGGGQSVDVEFARHILDEMKLDAAREPSNLSGGEARRRIGELAVLRPLH